MGAWPWGSWRGMASTSSKEADPLSATQRHVALGGNGAAPRQLADGCRWVGGQPVEIDDALVRKCADGTESGKIVDLNLHFKFLQQVRGLEQYAPHLVSLDLSSNNIREMSGFNGMVRLRDLKLFGCQISRIQGLQQCTSLAALHLEDNQISAIEGLEGLRQLEYLNLERNRIQRLGRGLGRLSKLRELRVGWNQLASLEGLVGLSALEVLSASHNRLQDLTPDQLKGLGRLDDLQLGGNQLRSIAFLAGSASASGGAPLLPRLTSLDVSGNSLTSQALKGLPPLSQLSELNLAANQIQELPAAALSCWPALEILDISANQISKVEEVRKLKSITSLRELVLEGNPLVSTEPGELHQALTDMDGLEFLDDRPLPPPAPEGTVDILDLEGPAGSSETFHLTHALAAGLGAGGAVGQDSAALLLRPGTGSRTGTAMRPGTAARPGTAGRPGTSSSRPSTAQSMKEAGVRDPLMHARVKLSERRFVGEEQVMQWEAQTKVGLAAIEQQVRHTVQQAEAELQEMSRFLQRAQRILQREREIQTSRGPQKQPSETEQAAGDTQGGPPARARARSSAPD